MNVLVLTPAPRGRTGAGSASRIADLVPQARNPRLHPKRQIELLAKSICHFGFIVPVVVDAQNRVLVGHARLLAARKLGRSEVPTIRLFHLSADEPQAFVLADNRLAELATWDDRLVAETLKGLSLVNLDFDLDATGFEMAEIDLQIEQLDACDDAEETSSYPDPMRSL